MPGRPHLPLRPAVCGPAGSPLVLECRLGAVASTVALITVLLDTSGERCAYALEFGPVLGKSREVVGKLAGDSRRIDVCLEDLHPDTEYAFQLSVSNRHGTTEAAEGTLTTTGPAEALTAGRREPTNQPDRAPVPAATQPVCTHDHARYPSPKPA